MRPEILFPLFAPATSLPGIGPRLAKAVEKAAGPIDDDQTIGSRPQSPGSEARLPHRTDAAEGESGAKPGAPGAKPEPPAGKPEPPDESPERQPPRPGGQDGSLG